MGVIKGDIRSLDNGSCDPWLLPVYTPTNIPEEPDVHSPGTTIKQSDPKGPYILAGPPTL